MYDNLRDFLYNSEIVWVGNIFLPLVPWCYLFRKAFAACSQWKQKCQDDVQWGHMLRILVDPLNISSCPAKVHDEDGIPYTGWWFQILFIFTPIWGRLPF